MSSWRDALNEPGEVIKSETLGVATTDSEMRRMYVDEEMSCGKIADELSVSYSTARRFVIEAGIEMRDHPDRYKNKKYRDEKWLREQYKEKEKSMTDIAERCGVSYSCISDWLSRYDIEKDDQHDTHCSFSLSGNSNLDGYPIWTATGGAADVGYLTVHRLVMVADGEDPHDVFGSNAYQVHHRNGFKCDNRPANLELVDRKEHGHHHSPGPAKWTDDDVESAIRFMMNPAQYLDG